MPVRGGVSAEGSDLDLAHGFRVAFSTTVACGLASAWPPWPGGPGSDFVAPPAAAAAKEAAVPGRTWFDLARPVFVLLQCGLEVGKMRIEIEQEEDGRWIAEVPDLSGVMVYGESRPQAIAKAEALALRVIADRLDHGESVPELDDLT